MLPALSKHGRRDQLERRQTSDNLYGLKSGGDVQMSYRVCPFSTLMIWPAIDSAVSSITAVCAMSFGVEIRPSGSLPASANIFSSWPSLKMAEASTTPKPDGAWYFLYGWSGRRRIDPTVWPASINRCASPASLKGSSVPIRTLSPASSFANVAFAPS